ncbi:FAD-dependent oxidoreductase [Aspergillus nidulans FGSC A4]|uniref:FAD dependent oxidoreductase domain-containing protein n=1 Tax=Emericella nidulans (strain FGSC A4 / ATCC 38163 / CBS 112.46 / NRRL 194 / M139) TaxID=227321 RepID=C8V6G0_EMENI|nr:hypothetical protein [Aspergillus nidulans FGSC A4]CBF75201.1 TPA: conserved hypothetical protein [Aspergillus nidulans FGSC A4]
MVLSQLTQPIIVIGGGTFGTSTAYHLSIKGYTKVTVLDRFPIPSSEAAGNDINKVVRTEYPEPLCTKLASDARDIWRGPNGLFAALYHPSGWIIGATDRSTPSCLTEEIHEKWPIMSGDLEGWKSFWSPNAAWVNAREGIVRMAQKAIDAGVSLFGSKIILAAGAATGSSLDLENQIVAKGHVVGHIQLTPDEVDEFIDMPILDHMKEARHCGGLKLGFEWIETRICWDGDMADYHFLITPHLRHKNLDIAIGGSAHGFKFLPVIGKYLVEMLEGTLDPEIAKKWRWWPGLELSDYTTNPHPEKPEDLNDTVCLGGAS